MLCMVQVNIKLSHSYDFKEFSTIFESHVAIPLPCSFVITKKRAKGETGLGQIDYKKHVSPQGNALPDEHRSPKIN